MVITTSGTDWEGVVASLFPVYEKLGIARLAMLPIPMAPAGRGIGGCPMYRPKSTSPFDVYGWTLNTGMFVACELKRSSRRVSMPIVGPKISGKGKLVPGKGNGLHAHQLEALASVARSGGFARLLWNNGGEVGVLDSPAILNVWQDYEPCLAGMFSEGGIRSIKWNRFRTDFPVLEGGHIADWMSLTGEVLAYPR